MTATLDAALTAAVATNDRLTPAAVDGTVALVVTGGSDGDVKVRVRLLAGRPVEAAEGPAPDAEVTLTLPAADAEAIAAGVLDPSVAFMRGRIKTAGDNGLVLRLLGAAAAPGFGPWLAGLALPAGGS